MLSVRTTPSIIRESFVRSTVRFASQCFKTHSFTSTIIPTTIAWWFVNHNPVEVQTGSSKGLWMITIDQWKEVADVGYVIDHHHTTDVIDWMLSGVNNHHLYHQEESFASQCLINLCQPASDCVWWSFSKLQSALETWWEKGNVCTSPCHDKPACLAGKQNRVESSDSNWETP